MKSDSCFFTHWAYPFLGKDFRYFDLIIHLPPIKKEEKKKRRIRKIERKEIEKEFFLKKIGEHIKN